VWAGAEFRVEVDFARDEGSPFLDLFDIFKRMSTVRSTERECVWEEGDTGVRLRVLFERPHTCNFSTSASRSRNLVREQFFHVTANSKEAAILKLYHHYMPLCSILDLYRCYMHKFVRSLRKQRLPSGVCRSHPLPSCRCLSRHGRFFRITVIQSLLCQVPSHPPPRPLVDMLFRTVNVVVGYDPHVQVDVIRSGFVSRKSDSGVYSGTAVDSQRFGE
jgi:hypothetical protein